VRLLTDPEPIRDNDDTIRAGVLDAPVPPLLAAVAHLTGDYSLLRDELRPDLNRTLEPNAGYSTEQLELARRLAADALIAHRDRGRPAAPPPSDDQLRRVVEFVNGGPVDGEYLTLLEEELALDADRRAPTWHVEPGATFTVAIIGAGMSGLAAAHRLRQAGVIVIILEKNSDVGGTWLENDYPGCRVDIQNHFYSYSFAQSSRWPQFHSRQSVLLDYFRTVTDEFGLRPFIRFSTEVHDMRWDESASQWVIAVTGPNADDQIRVNAVVSATGQLNRPLMPDIAGITHFAGPWFHSARWDHSVDLTNKRVAVVGTGASAAQFIPQIAEQVEQLTVFQRTPPWLLPVPTYESDLPDGLQWLLRHAPAYARWDRLWVFVRTQEGLLPLATVDPDWDNGGRSVGPLNDFLREILTGYYEIAFPDPELRAKVLPQYPPIAKRVVLDCGTYPAALQRPNVELDTSAIAEITRTGIRTVDGVEHEVDVIIYGTGFAASKFLTPMQVTGRDGIDLHERWGGDATAYLGIVVPDFPNLFLMYGPNTNIVINGSIIYFSECETQFIVEAVHQLLERHQRSLEVRPEVHDAYVEHMDAGNRIRAWGVSDVHSWYKNEFGRVAQNWPYNLFDYWNQTRTVNADDYVWR
jgi:4-hydroxyacetophenone monooxygenase